MAPQKRIPLDDMHSTRNVEQLPFHDDITKGEIRAQESNRLAIQFYIAIATCPITRWYANGDHVNRINPEISRNGTMSNARTGYKMIR